MEPSSIGTVFGCDENHTWDMVKYLFVLMTFQDRKNEPIGTYFGSWHIDGHVKKGSSYYVLCAWMILVVVGT